MPESKVLIGIPSYRRPEGLRRLIASLVAQRFDDLSIEVFVADNDPQGREALNVCEELAPNLPWPLICEIVDEPGISASRNAILDRAQRSHAGFVAMLDDDEIAAPDWLRELLLVQRQSDADVVGGPVLGEFGSEVSKEVVDCGLFHSRERADGTVALLDATGNVLISCKALDGLGWPKFDHDFGLTGGEDHEFFRRLKKIGARFAWAPRAVAKERIVSSRLRRSWILKRAFRIGNSDLRICKAHGTFGEVAMSIAKAIALLASAPLCSPLLLLRSRRLWILAKWSRSLGKLSAVFGHEYKEYGRRHDRSVH